MFILKKSPGYFWPVKVQLPADGGKHKTETFDVCFRTIPQSRITEVFAPDNDVIVKDVDFCNEIVTGWRGVKDESGAEVPFSEGAFAELLEMPSVAGAIAKAFIESVTGSKIKN